MAVTGHSWVNLSFQKQKQEQKREETSAEKVSYSVTSRHLITDHSVSESNDMVFLFISSEGAIPRD
jgi:hypothetical protein